MKQLSKTKVKDTGEQKMQTSKNIVLLLLLLLEKMRDALEPWHTTETTTFAHGKYLHQTADIK